MTRIEIIAGLKKELEDKDLEIAELKRQVNSLKDAHYDLEDTIKDQKIEIVELKEETEQLYTRLEDLDQQDPHLVRSREMYRELTKGMSCQK